MLESFNLKSCLTVIVLRIISVLLTVGVIAVYFFAIYPMPEKYDTEEEVRQSRAFDALVDATEKVYIAEVHHSDRSSFKPYKISFIYSGGWDSYTVYSKIDYTVRGESKTAYCETYCGKRRGKDGLKYTISSEIISENAYINQNSRIINSELEYNDLAVSTVYRAMMAN